ncbi:MAG TPA: molybdopterin-dependent oxidoreductase [Steroidobacteraceae bacterium]|nr:molybdopterin-dependent oxidoreductase [Steroidobacteraceae bacterium]
MSRIESTACILCSRNCGLRVEIEDASFIRIRGDDDHPASRGYLCQKAARLEHYQNHADRLRQPLKRLPDGSHEPIGWDQALDEIARHLVAIRERHGGKAFAFAGGGGQGNHLGGVYSRQLLSAMRSRYAYNSLGQEKTGDFWVNGRLFGSQSCHVTEDVEHADYVVFIGCNPFQSHGIPNARDTLRELRKDPSRTMVVVDPHRTETAKQADIHLQLRPGTDAYLLAAMLAIVLQEGLHDREFLARHCNGFEDVERQLRQVPIEDYVHRADVPLADVQRVARGFARARRACLRVDLGTQHTLHTTLNAYLEKLLWLVTGKFGAEGTNNLHTSLLPLLGHTDERRVVQGKPLPRTAHHGMHPIAGIFPPSILPDEILHAGEDRIRAVVVDSANPLLTWPDSAAFEQAFASLELLVVVDVAMTETARLAHYVLPAASQFEKWEATGFNMEFPSNYFHLRHPLFEPLAQSLPEPEIYTRLLENMGVMPRRFPVLEAIARAEPTATRFQPYVAALGLTLATRKALVPYAASILYRSLGPTLPDGAAAAAFLLPLAMQYASRHPAAVRRAGHRGNRFTLGSRLFEAILERRSGVVLSQHEHDDVWSLVRNPDRKIRLDIPEMLRELAALERESVDPAAHPFILMAGERRSYNANQIYRDPAWRKVDKDGVMRMHPEDAAALGLADGIRAVVESDRGRLEVTVEIDDGVRRGVVTLPHGYGATYAGRGPIGPAINRLTASDHCDPFTKTPYHKYVPVTIVPMAAAGGDDRGQGSTAAPATVIL